MIRLHSLSIQRYRGIREGSLDGLTDVNVLVGRNNSGKSTVVEAIMRLLFGQNTDRLGRRFEQIWSEIRRESTDSPSVWYRQDKSTKIVVEGRLGESKGAASEKELTLTLEIPQFSASASPIFQTTAVEGGLTQDRIAEFSKGVFLFRPLDAVNESIERRLWPGLLPSRRDKALTRTLNSIFGLRAEGFQLLPDNRLMVMFEDHSLPLDVQGDGTRGAFRAMICLTMVKGSMFLMEEPECHQHPESLERFARAVCSLARENDVQLVISTHSAECVGCFLRAAAEAGSESAVFHLTLLDGHQEARRLDPEAVATLQSTGVDIRLLDLYA
jgi:predicted ATPase